MTSDDNQQLDLDDLAILLAAGTQGPWEAHTVTARGNGGRNLVADTIGSQRPETDAELIAALRNAAPALIAAARGRDGLLGRLREVKLERDAVGNEVAALRSAGVDALESLDLLCRAEDTHGDNIRAHEVRGATGDLRAALALTAWPCSNYRAPLSCLTAPSSETGRCDHCRAQEPTASEAQR